MPKQLLAGVLLAIAVAVMASCARFHSVISTNLDGLRVFSWVDEWGGVLYDCAGPASGGLAGTLAGDQASPVAPVWLVAEDGRRLSMVWPAGFRVQSSPGIALVDDRGHTVAREGDLVRLVNVYPESAAGTTEDPYIADGFVFDGCYQYVE